MNVARFERHFSDPSVLSSTNIKSVATTEHRLMIIMMKCSGRYLCLSAEHGNEPARILQDGTDSTAQDRQLSSR